MCLLLNTVNEDDFPDTLTKSFIDPWRLLHQKLTGYQSLIEEVVDTESVIRRAGTGYSPENKLWNEKWLKIRPSINSDLQKLDKELLATRTAIKEEVQRIVRSANVDSKYIHLEHSSTHGIHLRVTKKDQASILGKLKSESVTVLAVVKAGALFRTQKVKTIRPTYA